MVTERFVPSQSLHALRAGIQGRPLIFRVGQRDYCMQHALALPKLICAHVRRSPQRGFGTAPPRLGTLTSLLGNFLRRHRQPPPCCSGGAHSLSQPPASRLLVLAMLHWAHQPALLSSEAVHVGQAVAARHTHEGRVNAAFERHAFHMAPATFSSMILPPGAASRRIQYLNPAAAHASAGFFLNRNPHPAAGGWPTCYTFPRP